MRVFFKFKSLLFFASAAATAVVVAVSIHHPVSILFCVHKQQQQQHPQLSTATPTINAHIVPTLTDLSYSCMNEWMNVFCFVLFYSFLTHSLTGWLASSCWFVMMFGTLNSLSFSYARMHRIHSFIRSFIHAFIHLLLFFISVFRMNRVQFLPWYTIYIEYNK